jgi:Family of unknown function (DUF6339)
MKSLELFRRATVDSLFESVPNNLDRYRSGDFKYLLEDSGLFVNITFNIDEEAISQVSAISGSANEVDTCVAVWNLLPGLTDVMAREERMWARLTHIELLDYSRARWSIPDDNDAAVSHIRAHFFAKGSRGLERNNAISRLWWMSAICSKVNDLDLRKALEAFLYQSDVRANIIERPSTSQNPEVLSSIIKALDKSLSSDKALHERSMFRGVMKKLNLEGGVRLLDVLDEAEINKIVESISSETVGASSGPNEV